MIEWVGAPVRFRESGRGIPDCFISLVCFGSSSRRGPICWGRIYVEGLAGFFPLYGHEDKVCWIYVPAFRRF